MATRPRSLFGVCWGDAARMLRRAGGGLWCIASAQVDVQWLLLSLHERLSRQPRAHLLGVEGSLAALWAAAFFVALLSYLGSGGDRWLLTQLSIEFDFPSIPEHALKVYSCCKYLFAMCLVYNVVRYLLERRAGMAAHMDRLELEAAAARGERRLDATVPRPDDDATTREPRRLIAVRRLFWRNVFTFDVVPEAEPEPQPPPQPTEEEVRQLREALELEAVKRLNDPRMLREYIRRRESRMGRRKVHLTKSKDRRKSSRKALKIESPMTAIKEEESSSQLSDLLRQQQESMEASLRRTKSRSSESPASSGSEQPLSDADDSVRAAAGPDAQRTPSAVGEDRSEDMSQRKAQRPPLQAAKWPVSGTCRPTSATRPASASRSEKGVAAAPKVALPGTAPQGARAGGACAGAAPTQVKAEGPCVMPRGRSGSRASGRADRTPSDERAAPRQRYASPRAHGGATATSAAVAAVEAAAWEKVLPLVQAPPPPRTPSPADLTTAPCDPPLHVFLSDDSGEDTVRWRPPRGNAPAADSVQQRNELYEREASALSPSASTSGDDAQHDAFYSSGDSDLNATDDLPEDSPSEGTWPQRDGQPPEGAKGDVEIADLLQPRAGWSDSLSSLSGLSPSFASTVTALSEVTPSSFTAPSDDTGRHANF